MRFEIIFSIRSSLQWSCNKLENNRLKMVSMVMKFRKLNYC